jgi:hypothetical protein
MDDGAAVGVRAEVELIAFADSAIARDGSLPRSREAVAKALGPAAMVDAAAVIAGFDAIPRVADGSGIPLEEQKAAATESWRSALGIDAFWKAKI